MNCVDCNHYRIETHIAPSIGTCSAVDSQLGCEKCKTFSPIASWKHCGAGKIRCPLRNPILKGHMDASRGASTKTESQRIEVD